MAQIRPNRVRRKIKRGEPAFIFGGHNDPHMVDMLGHVGFDGAWIEAEHGPVDFADIPDITRACDVWGMTSIVRVNLNLPGVIYRTLDLGAQGIVMPHVNTADEARAVVDGSRFTPIGHRGDFYSRQSYGVGDFFARANDETLVVILIEDIVAIDNLADILTVDHIDVFFVAPGDLAQSMGYPGEPGHPEVQAIVDKAVAQINAAGRVAGGVTSEETVVDDVRKGVRVLLASWIPMLTSAASGFLDKAASA